MTARGTRPILWILGLLIVLAIVAGLLGVQTARRSFPQTDGSLQVPGLEHPVEVFRDAMGVPSLYAQTQHDLFFAQGFVQAQDRFWQMDVSRHIGTGRLAEMFGEGQLDTDLFLRTLGWARVAQQEWDAMDAELKAVLEAYAEGVNAYLAQRSGAGALARVRRAGLDQRRIRAGAVDTDPHHHLGQGDGLGSGRQHDERDRPLDPRQGTPGRRGRPALPALPRESPDHHRSLRRHRPAP